MERTDRFRVGLVVFAGVVAALEPLQRAAMADWRDAAEHAVADSPDPELAMEWLMHRLRLESIDLDPAASDDALEDAFRELLPTSPEFSQPWMHFNTTNGLVWTGIGQQGTPGEATPASLTYSFPANNVAWGFSGREQGPNDLNTWLVRTHGAQNLDLGRELIRQSFGAWAHDSGLSFIEVADNDSVMSSSATHSADRGDIRIAGAYELQSANVAYNGFPNTHNDLGTLIFGGSDMFLNTAFFSLDDTAGYLATPAGDFMQFRGVVAHELGHGFGFHHVFPAGGGFIMETGSTLAGPFVQALPGIDDLRNATANYGDRYSLNHDALSATQFGMLAPGDGLVAPALATNGEFGANGTSTDVFSFSLASGAALTLRATPMGGSYDTTDPLNLNPSIVNALEAGDLRLEFTDLAVGTPVITNSGGAGVEEIYNALLGAGDFEVRVVDDGPNDPVNQIVQMYDLRIDLGGGGPAPPTAFIGVQKRVAADTSCFFFGDLLSRANQSGATITQYDWDLDGDSVYETLGNARPVTTYSTEGVVTVSLRVTDSNGQVDEHSIDVTVIATPLFLALVDLDDGKLMRGRSADVTLHGWRLDTLAAPTDVVLDPGIDVSVSGTPVSQFDTVTGIVFTASPTSVLGRHNVFISTPAGISVAMGELEVVAFGDISGDGVVDGADLAAMLAAWGACGSPCLADLDESGTVDGADLAALLAAWS